MKKRGFTFAELLVAVAVVAVLASVMVPIVQASGNSIDKTGLTNQRQIAMAINMYADDYDDYLPRQDGCVRNSSLNPALNGAPDTEDPDPKCRNLNNVGFMWRINHFSWQKWVLPYVKNVQVFQHPSRPLFRNQWNDNGQLMGSFTLNTALGGQLDTYRDINRARAFRDSWLGGTRSAIPNRDRAWLLNEMGNLLVCYAPVLIEDGNANNRVTVFPTAIREIWGRELMRWKFPDCGGALLDEISNEPNPVATTNGGMAVAFVDGSVRFMSAQEFLRNTPTLQDLQMNLITNQCGFTGGVVRYDRNTPPNIRIDFPMWGFQP